MTEIVSVRFNNRGKAYYFDPSGLTLNKGDDVIVETAKGLEYGECTRGNSEVGDDAVVKPLRAVVRVATEADRQSVKASKAKEKEAFDYCRKRIAESGLEMKLVGVEYSFEGNRILFFFTSEGRVDFRDLVKDLASQYRARIELRQIGVRDETKMLGGLGVCGRPFCCSQFLREFHPVSIKMAKIQGLSLNPTKISGSCGRLMCCLKYEDIAYEDLVKKAPKTDAFVETPSGKGTVTNVNLLRGNAKVRLEEGLDTTLKTFEFDELEILGGKGRRAEYIAAKAEGRLLEAGFTESPTQKKPRSAEAPRQSARDGAASASSAAAPQARTAGDRHDRKSAPNQKKKPPPAAAGERPAKEGDKNPKAPRQHPPGGAQAKKPYFKRNKGGQGKNKPAPRSQPPE